MAKNVEKLRFWRPNFFLSVQKGMTFNEKSQERHLQHFWLKLFNLRVHFLFIWNWDLLDQRSFWAAFKKVVFFNLNEAMHKITLTRNLSSDIVHSALDPSMILFLL